MRNFILFFAVYVLDTIQKTNKNSMAKEITEKHFFSLSSYRLSFFRSGFELDFKYNPRSTCTSILGSGEKNSHKYPL